MTPPRPRRIARLITRLHVSGTALQAILLTAKLRERGDETFLLIGETPPDEDNLLAVAEQYGITPIILPDLTRTLNPLRHWRAIRQIAGALRAIQPDIVHTHMTTAGFWGRIVARLLGVKVVVHTLHVHPFRGYYNRVQSGVFAALERIGAYFSDSIITLSEKLRRELTDRHRITRKSAVIVLPLGLDLGEFERIPRHAGTIRAQYGIEPDAPLIGIVARLIAVKNHKLFFKACQRILAEVPNARFLVVGDGELRAALEQEVNALGIESAVIFTGWLDNMPAVYADLDVLALSSWNEGTPVPIIEALVSGCAVVSTDVGGVADLLDGGKFGALVPRDDCNALTDALLQALRTPYSGEVARQAMRSRYGLDRLIEELDSLYRGLLLSKGVQE